MNRRIVAVASLCIAVALLSPVISHNYFCNILSDSLQENEDLKERIRQYMKPYDPYLMEPYLAAELGWYLHNSSDPVPESRNKLTLYGQVLNIGAVNATKCRLTVSFYVGGDVAQTSEVHLGEIRYWGYRYLREVIGCELADRVTRIEVSRDWS